MKKGIIFILLFVAFGLTKKEQCSNNTTYATDKNEEYIINNYSGIPINSRFTPVLIYRVVNDIPKFVGSGSMFSKKSGNFEIITSEHLFGNQRGENMYLFKIIDKDNSSEYYGVEKVLSTGLQLTSEPADVTTLQVGKPEYIKGFSIHSEKNFRVRSKYENIGSVTSLVTGKEVAVIGTARKTDQYDEGVGYLVLDYSSINGESGTGFVDENDNIYVLKGTNYEFNTPNGVQRAAIVYGPLNP